VAILELSKKPSAKAPQIEAESDTFKALVLSTSSAHFNLSRGREMELFSLEALDARSGDCLLIHYGVNQPGLMLIDGGFASTYYNVLRPRLMELRDDRVNAEEPLTIDQLVVSHLDQDHIGGIERLFQDLRRVVQEGLEETFRIRGLWANFFDDSAAAAIGTSVLAEIEERVAAVRPQSVSQARVVRDIANLLGVGGNPPFNGLVFGPNEIDLGNGLIVTVVAPTQGRLDALRTQWLNTPIDRSEQGAAEAASYLDTAVPNLSSIVMHLRFQGKTMLLTGDGRGDETLIGLEQAGLFDANGTCVVDVLKLPHHGSDRNIDHDYFERIVARHYVISADGRFDNPSRETFRLLTETQGSREYEICLTSSANTDFFASDHADNDRNYQVRIRADAERSITVHVGSIDND
jgi:hypothetical protein